VSGCAHVGYFYCFRL